MEKLKIAIQKSGRLSEQSKQLLKDCGIKIKNGKNALRVSASNFPLDLFYLRDDDIPQYVQDGIADIGIVGENVLLEKKTKCNIVQKLGFAKCRLSLAIPKSIEYKGIEYFKNKKIATSYPVILSDFLSKHNVKSEIHEISGSVEIAPNIGLADAICDLVSTGSTLFSNGLIEVEEVLKSEAVIIGKTNFSSVQQSILDKLIFRIQAVQKGRNSKYVILNAPNEKIELITGIIPGLKSPTVVPLAENNWSAVHSVISEDVFWDVIDELKNAGAEGILVMPVEKMII
ncbi:MAG: ATP phosphoribosyltransferase [Bacteroidetes bacterium]|jgi:ATP phosphoribosyltransferase|nr:ATP phosphoribosyltransferase [Bacteroidota bacterium]MDF1864673.1 ATP phosphoribosyltransferase [Saprospiraceae bacterium]